MAISVPDGLVQITLSFIVLLQEKRTQLSEGDGGRKRENQVMGYLIFKEQAYLPHAQSHHEDAHLPADQRSLWSPGKRDQRRLSQLTTQLATVLCCLLHSLSVAFPATQRRNILFWATFQKMESSNCEWKGAVTNIVHLLVNASNC